MDEQAQILRTVAFSLLDFIINNTDYYILIHLLTLFKTYKWYYK